MRAIVGAILILAGSVLAASGIVADGVNKSKGEYGIPGYILGGIVGLFGIIVLFAGPAKWAWDAIPIDDKKTGQPKPP